MNLLQWIKKSVIGGHCTLWPEGIWSSCCKQHDIDTDNPLRCYIVSNWWMAACVHASSYSPKVTSWFWRYAARYVAPPFMFVGTSTIGWFWRFYSLMKKRNEAMKRGLAVSLVVAMIVLSGCGLSVDLTADDLKQLATTQEQSRITCQSQQAQLLSQELKIMAGMSKEKAFHYALMRQQARDMKELAAILTGGSVDQCGGGTNIYDVLVAELRERNESLREGIKTGGSVGKFWIGADAATDIFDSVMAKVGNNYRMGDNNLLSDVGNEMKAGRDGVQQTGGMNQADRNDIDTRQTQRGTTTGPNATESPFSDSATDNRPIEYAPEEPEPFMESFF